MTLSWILKTDIVVGPQLHDRVRAGGRPKIRCPLFCCERQHMRILQRYNGAVFSSRRLA